MHDDPVLGSGIYRQTSHLGPERAYIMHQQLAELENGKWRENLAFDEYLEVLEGVMSAGKVSAGGREFVELVPVKFLTTYQRQYSTNML